MFDLGIGMVLITYIDNYVQVCVCVCRALLLLLSSGYIGLRIAALEEQLNTLGARTEFGLQRS